MKHGYGHTGYKEMGVKKVSKGKGINPQKRGRINWVGAKCATDPVRKYNRS